MSRAAIFAALGLLALSCADEGGPMRISDGPVVVDTTARPPELLSDMRALQWNAETQTIEYNDRVVAYDLNTPLFSDYALKARAVYLPEGQAMSYDADGVFRFPVGAAIFKTFYFPADLREPDANITLIETRVLIHTEDGWEAWPYVWNEEQTEAVLDLGGESRAISFVDAEGASQTASYLIPQRNQCSSCHERNLGEGGEPVISPIGPAARNLNRDYDYGDGPTNQLAHLAGLGMLDGMPDLGSVPAAYDFTEVMASGADVVPDAEVEFAARSYLDINCAHCHDAQGTQGVTSQLFLNHDNDDTFRLGFCKRPGSAGAGTGGLTYDIVPGDPDQSILVFRVETTEVGAMMPLLGRSLQHANGAALVRRWVANMDPVDCDMMME